MLGMICRCVKAEGSDGSSLTRSSALLSQLILPVADVVKLVPQAKEEMKKSPRAKRSPKNAREEAGEAREEPATPTRSRRSGRVE